jgi:hypothetical protein
MVSSVSNRCVNNRTVAQVLDNRRWVSDIQGSLSMEGLVQYLQIWVSIQGFTLIFFFLRLGFTDSGK